MTWNKKRKLVKCNDCGFIGIIHARTAKDIFIHTSIASNINLSEILPTGREHLKKLSFGEPALIRCYRGQVSWVVDSSAKPEIGLGNRDAISASLREDRNCPYFYKYVPGYNPSEHKVLQRESEERQFTTKVAIISALIGAVVGGLIAALVNLVANSN